MQKSYNGWENLQTLQSREMLAELNDAKENQRAKMLISDTGLGKSKSIEIFRTQLPQHTYCVVVGDSFKLSNVLDELMYQMEIPNPKPYRMDNNDKMKAIREKIDSFIKSAKPIIIIDEAENLKPAALKMLKELYDAVHTRCGIVMIGTEQILDAILNRKHKNRQSVPQLWRRFKAGTRYITPLNKARDFKPFYDKYIPGNLDLQDLLNEVAENYGELHDYMDSYLRFASHKGMAPDEKSFRLFHKIPKTTGKLRRSA